MVTFTELYHLDAGSLKNASDRWTDLIRMLGAMDEAYTREVAGPFDAAGWTSFDPTFAIARAQVINANKEFTDAVQEANGIRAVLDDSYTELKQYRADLRTLADVDAKKDGVVISQTGQVSLRNPSAEGDERRGPGGLMPSENETKILFYEARIGLILTGAGNSRMVLDSLGPEKTLRLAEDLEQQRNAGNPGKERYNTIQSALANNIATANKDKAYSDKWRADMQELGMEEAGDYPSTALGYQSITTLLKHGDAADYPPHMTTGLTDDILKAENEHPGLWDEHTSVNVGADVVPVDNMLGIMSKDPDTATRYLDPAPGRQQGMVDAWTYDMSLKYKGENDDAAAAQVAEESLKSEREMDYLVEEWADLEGPGRNHDDIDSLQEDIKNNHNTRQDLANDALGR